MPAKFSLSFSARWNLARSRRHDFPTSPIFSQVESGGGVNLVRVSSRSSTQFNRTMRRSALWRQKAKPLDSNFQHSSLQLTAKRCRVPSLNRLATFPRDSRASSVRGVKRIQARIRFHVSRIPSAFDRLRQSDDATTIRRHFHFRTPNFAEYRTPLNSMLDWPKTTSVA
jgi:hypothetical protein